MMLRPLLLAVVVVGLAASFTAASDDVDPEKMSWYCRQCTCTKGESKRGAPLMRIDCNRADAFEGFDAKTHDPSMYCVCREDPFGDLEVEFSPLGTRNSAFAATQRDSWSALSAEVGAFIDQVRPPTPKAMTEEFASRSTGLLAWASAYVKYLRDNGRDSGAHDRDPRNNYNDVRSVEYTRPNIGLGDYVNANYIMQDEELFNSVLPSEQGQRGDSPFLLAAVEAALRRAKVSDPQIVATQGPMTGPAVEPFVKLLSVFGADLVVAVGPASEKGRVKFQDYFGEPGFTRSAGGLSVTTLAKVPGTKAIDAPYTGAAPPKGIDLYSVVVRNPTLGSTLPLTVLHFVDWEDMQATDINLTMWASQFMNNYHRTVVHCSAGVGRTGTLIAVNLMLKHAVAAVSGANTRDHTATVRMMKNALSPKHVVKILKAQREFMVMRPEQYSMLFDSAKAILNKIVDVATIREQGIEAAHSILRAVPKASFDVDAADLAAATSLTSTMTTDEISRLYGIVKVDSAVVAPVVSSDDNVVFSDEAVAADPAVNQIYAEANGGQAEITYESDEEYESPSGRNDEEEDDGADLIGSMTTVTKPDRTAEANSIRDALYAGATTDADAEVEAAGSQALPDIRSEEDFPSLPKHEAPTNSADDELAAEESGAAERGVANAISDDLGAAGAGTAGAGASSSADELANEDLAAAKQESQASAFPNGEADLSEPPRLRRHW